MFQESLKTVAPQKTAPKPQPTNKQKIHPPPKTPQKSSMQGLVPKKEFKTHHYKLLYVWNF